MKTPEQLIDEAIENITSTDVWEKREDLPSLEGMPMPMRQSRLNHRLRACLLDGIAIGRRIEQQTLLSRIGRALGIVPPVETREEAEAVTRYWLPGEDARVVGTDVEVFHQLMQNNPPKADPLIEFGLRYHQLCESYDRAVCPHLDKNGDPYPTNQHQSALVRRNADNVWQAIKHEILASGLATHENVNDKVREAIRAAAPIYRKEKGTKTHEGSNSKTT